MIQALQISMVCHHQKGGECKSKLLNQMVLMKTTWITNYQERMDKKFLSKFYEVSSLEEILKILWIKIIVKVYASILLSCIQVFTKYFMNNIKNAIIFKLEKFCLKHFLKIFFLKTCCRNRFLPIWEPGSSFWKKTCLWFFTLGTGFYPSGNRFPCVNFQIF